ncbi:hypothetical protein QYM36_003014 [Artemia franciscana]|uniref:Uncharacterized protein n=1 Tax=Artemia franciscana TaxID=6661 RepID=A0AA88L8S6_ARTSF|nr:hypothetical protein QYM36_003014 [Artemia franciscana]
MDFSDITAEELLAVTVRRAANEQRLIAGMLDCFETLMDADNVVACIIQDDIEIGLVPLLISAFCMENGLALIKTRNFFNLLQVCQRKKIGSLVKSRKKLTRMASDFCEIENQGPITCLLVLNPSTETSLKSEAAIFDKILKLQCASTG